MTITHDAKYKREDGIEVEIVPLKDIVVTAPGYPTYGYHNDWRAEADHDAHQGTQLYNAAMKKMPKETDTWECVNIHQSSDGGNATYRAYIEKVKVPALRERIRQEMTGIQKPFDFFSKKGKVVFSKPFMDCYEHRAELVVNNADGHMVRNSFNPEISEGEFLFFSPDYRLPSGEKVEGLEIKYDLYEEKVMLKGYSFKSLSSILNFQLNQAESGLLDHIRAEILREIIGEIK